MLRERIAASAAGLALLLALTACGGSAEPTGEAATDPTPSPRATPTASATPTPARTPTSTPGPAPTPAPTPAPSGPAFDDPSSWRITADGVGPIRLGGDLEETAAALGGSLFDYADPSPCRGMDLVRVGGVGVNLAGTEGRVQTIQLLRPDGGTVAPEQLPRTVDGLTLGTTTAQMEAARGPATLDAWGAGAIVAWAEAEGPHTLILGMDHTAESADAGVVERIFLHDQGLDGWPPCFD